MNTLSISVQEFVTVKDVVGYIRRILKTILAFMKPEKAQKIEKPEVDRNDNKSPPDLGIAVDDGTNVGEALG